MSEAEDIAGRNLGLPTPQGLLTELAALGEDEVGKRRRVHDIIRKLGAATPESQQEYRDALVNAGHIAKGDFRSALSSAKKAAEAEHRDRAASSMDYLAGDDGCLYLDLGSERGRQMIANFVPQVVEDIVRDDGAERTQLSRIRVTLHNGRSGEVDVTPERLREARTWAVQAAGAGACLAAVSRAPEHALAAAQTLGQDHGRSVLYGHTGWRRIDGVWRFLTTSGGLGAKDLDETVSVDLGDEVLNLYRLPNPTHVPAVTLCTAVRAALDLRTVIPAALSLPQLGAAYRAALPLSPDAAVWVLGLSGFGKSTFATVVQQHFGAALDGDHMPGNWASSGNRLEADAFRLANVVFLVDDYNPKGHERDQSSMRQAAERLVRGSANSVGRGRLRRDGTPAPTKRPRAQVLSTGEDLPSGHSLRARLVVTEVEQTLIAAIAKSNCQARAAEGVYALAMAGYIQWLAGQYDGAEDFPATLKEIFFAKRNELAGLGGHARTPEATASLLLGWEMWLRYAADIGAISAEGSSRLYSEVKATLLSLAREQETHQQEMDPVRIYCLALVTAVTSGQAHLADVRTGQPPASPQRWGWKESGGEYSDWRAVGPCIGWVSGDDVYLDAGSAHSAALLHAARANTPVGFGATAMRTRLKAAGLLASTDGKNLQVVREILGQRRRVLHVLWGALCD